MKTTSVLTQEKPITRGCLVLHVDSGTIGLLYDTKHCNQVVVLHPDGNAGTILDAGTLGETDSTWVYYSGKLTLEQ